MSDALLPDGLAKARARAARIAEYGGSSRAVIASRFVLGLVFVIVLTLAAWPHLPRRYYSEAKVVMLTDVQDGIPDPSRVTRTFQDEAVTQSQIDLISSPLLASQVVEKCRLLDNPEFTQENPILAYLRSIPAIDRLLPEPVPNTALTVRRRLEKRLYLNRDRKSYTVTFGYWSRNPDDAAAMTKVLLDAYTDMQKKRRQEAIQRISHWLDSRVAAVREQTLKSEDNIRAFMETSGLVDEGAQSYLEHELAELSIGLARAETDLVRSQIKASTLQVLKAARTVQNAPEMIASTSVQKLREQLATAYSGRPNAMVPQASILTEQIGAEGDRIVASAAIEANDMEKRRRALEERIQNIRVKLADRVRAKLHLDELQREAKANESVLEVAMEKARERTDLAMSVAPEIEIAAVPEPAQKPSFPDPILGLVGTLLAGCLCGAMLNWRDVAPALASRVGASNVESIA